MRTEQKMKQILETDRLILREMTQDDYPAVCPEICERSGTRYAGLMSSSNVPFNLLFLSKLKYATFS